GSINERLERRTRLPQRLYGAIELALAVAEAANERTHATGVGIERHQRALDFRNLGQVENTLLLRRRHVDNVANREHVAYGGDFRSDTSVLAGLTCPAHVLQRDAARLTRRFELPVDLPRPEADLGLSVADGENHREPPRLKIRWRVDLAEGDTPIAVG